MASAKGKLGWLAPATVAIGLAPLAKLGVAAFTGGLGANPIAEGMNRLGFWTLTFLSLSLDVEINGHWPWETTKLAQKQPQGEPPLAAAE